MLKFRTSFLVLTMEVINYLQTTTERYLLFLLLSRKYLNLKYIKHIHFNPPNSEFDVVKNALILLATRNMNSLYKSFNYHPTSQLTLPTLTLITHTHIPLYSPQCVKGRQKLLVAAFESLLCVTVPFILDVMAHYFTGSNSFC